LEGELIATGMFRQKGICKGQQMKGREVINSDRESPLPLAKDAIPIDAIGLTDAFWAICELFFARPEFSPQLDQYWTVVLEESRQLELRRRASEIDTQHEHEWHRAKLANVFFRLALKGQKLVARIRDPDAGDVLQLSSVGWLDWDPDDDIPAVTATDYIIPGDDDCAGPSGTFIRGELRPVFFLRSEFEFWLKAVFDEATSFQNVSQQPNSALNQPRDHRFQATKQAIRVIWGSTGPPV
jgi:hypothetical protein